MAYNATHIRNELSSLLKMAESAKSQIEDKETVTDWDEDRIAAYEALIDAIEQAWDDWENSLND